MGAEDITRIYCPNPSCAKRLPLDVTERCPYCSKDLYETQRRTAQVSRARMFAAHAAMICAKLETDGRPFALKLAESGALLIASFRAWDVGVPEREERHKQINDLITWQRQAEGYLSGER